VQLYGADSLSTTPAAVTGGPNVIDLFALGIGGDLIHMYMTWRFAGGGPPATYVYYYSPSWGNIEHIVPDLQLAAAPPCPTNLDSQRLDVFAADPEGTVQHVSWNPSAGWTREALPGVVVQPV
jgi:hypothetical protein